MMPRIGDFVLWRGRTTLVQVDGYWRGMVCTRGRPGVSGVIDKPSNIRFWLRAASLSVTIGREA